MGLDLYFPRRDDVYGGERGPKKSCWQFRVKG